MIKTGEKMKRRDFLKSAACVMTGASAIASAPITLQRKKTVEAEGDKSVTKGDVGVDNLDGDVISKARQQKVFLRMTPSGTGINTFLRYCEKQVEQRFLEETGWPVRIRCTMPPSVK